MLKLMTSLLFVILSAQFQAQALERIELGIAAGTTHPAVGETFKQNATEGNSQHYWLGYSLDDNWAVELGQDQLDFDKANSRHKSINLSGVYRFMPQSWVHPIAKLGVGTVESESATDVKTNSMGAKAALGLEADFKYVSTGVLAQHYYMAKSDSVADLKDTQAIVPALFLTVHTALNSGAKSASTAPAAQAQTAAAPVDSDSDGIYDQDDLCPNTSAGVVVNSIGCSEKEKASIRLSVEFATGKADLQPRYNSEVSNLANFMKRFPETNVEIAGHTDSLGAAAANTSLSQRRADAVKAALVNAGIAAERVTAKGYGSAQPVADNKTKAGRDQNRRVTAEISVDTDKKK